MRPGNVLIRASAGSGKTFQLAHRAIALALHGTPVDQILATTFTRKAAGEILQRVLVRLATAASDDDARAELAAVIGRPEVTQAHLLTALTSMVDALHRLQIGTLDAFFAQIAACFHLELGLPDRWSIVEGAEVEPLRREAIDRVVEAHVDDLAPLMRMLDRGQSRRSVTRQILNVVSDLQELYVESSEEVWQRLTLPTPLSDDALAAAMTQLEAVFVRRKGQATARGTDVAQARGEDWRGLISSGIAGKLVAGDPDFGGAAIPPDLVAAYRPVLEHARAVLLTQLHEENLATFRLLEHFDRHYQEIKIARRSLEFSDITRTLDVVEALGRLDEVFFRIDGRIGHVLLDEFQDTSRVQWNVLRGLAEEVAAHADAERSLFVVGDAKQAIYGWRGGESAIFDHLEATLPQLEKRRLDSSWRSSPPIIDAVNQVFGGLDENEVAQRDKHAAGTRRWQESFAPHQTVHTARAGRVEIEVAPEPAKGGEPWLHTLQHAAGRVAQLLEQSAGHDIGVLVRTNAAVARMRFELKERGIEASEEGGIPLTDSPAVGTVLSALTLADHPGDSVAFAHLLQGPLATPLALDASTPPPPEAVAARIRATLMDRGYGETLMEWARALAPHCAEQNLRRLQQLVQLGHRADARATLRPGDFVREVQRTRVEDPRQERVRVMTIHQAKGLEFSVVVLPELREHLVRSFPGVLVGRDHPLGPPVLVSRSSTTAIRRFWPELEAVDETRVAADVEESLSLLYVAMTRAKLALHVVLDPSRSGERIIPNSLGGVLRAGFAPEVRAEPGQILFAQGDADWASRVEPEDRWTERPAEEFTLPPAVARPERTVAAPRASWHAARRRARGTRAHAWLERVRWLEEGVPEIRDGEGLGDVDELAAELLERITQPSLSAWFSREKVRKAWALTDLEVWREREFAVARGDEVQRGRYDRVVLGRRDGVLCRAQIVDFKTDEVESDAHLEQRVAEHRAQMVTYARALSQTTGLAFEQIGTTLLFLDAARAVDLELAGEAR